PGRRPPAPAPDHRRADVRGAGADGPGVRRRVRHPPARVAAAPAHRGRGRQRRGPRRPGRAAGRARPLSRRGRGRAPVPGRAVGVAAERPIQVPAGAVGSVTSAPMAEIRVTLPDGSTRTVEQGATALDLARSIGPRLARDAVIAESNGEERDLATELHDGDRVAIVTADSERGLYTIRHSTAHVLAQAVLDLFPGAT